MEQDPIQDARSAALTDVVETMVLKLMMNLNQSGYGTPEILRAFRMACERQQKAYDEDPDPAEDPLS